MSFDLYATDNGAIYCEAHLGATAKATGRDISGQEIHLITDFEASIVLRDSGDILKCETCGRDIDGVRHT